MSRVHPILLLPAVSIVRVDVHVTSIGSMQCFVVVMYIAMAAIFNHSLIYLKKINNDNLIKILRYIMYHARNICITLGARMPCLFNI